MPGFEEGTLRVAWALEDLDRQLVPGDRLVVLGPLAEEERLRLRA